MGIVNGESLECVFKDGFVSRDIDINSSEFAGPRPEVKFCLVEITKEQLAEMEAGGPILFHGHSSGHVSEKGEQASLSTGSKTFGLEFLENSNTIFVAEVNTPVPVVEASPAGEVAASNKVSVNDASANKAEPVPEGNEISEKCSEAGKSAAEVPLVLAKQAQIFAQVRGHVMLTPHNADHQRIRELTAPHALRLDPEELDAEDAERQQPLTTTMLEYKSGVSSAELQIILAAGPFVEVDGAWRYLTGAVEREILDVALTIVAARGLSLEALDAEGLFHEVRLQFGKGGETGIPTVAVLRKALRSVEAEPPKPPETKEGSKDGAKPGDTKDAKEAVEAKDVKEAGESNDTVPDGATDSELPATVDAESAESIPNRMKLDAAKIKKFRALQLLRESPTVVRQRFDLQPPPPRPKRARVGGAGLSSSVRDPPLRLEEFAAALQDSVGITAGGDEGGDSAGKDGEEPKSAEALEKELDKICEKSWHVDLVDGTVHLLDATMLPHEPRERLKRLFEIQSHWRPEKLAEHIEPVLGQGVKVTPWLMKNTRPAFLEIEKPGVETRCLVKKFVGIG